jgi:hypothetical protein
MRMTDTYLAEIKRWSIDSEKDELIAEIEALQDDLKLERQRAADKPSEQVEAVSTAQDNIRRLRRGYEPGRGMDIKEKDDD